MITFLKIARVLGIIVTLGSVILYSPHGEKDPWVVVLLIGISSMSIIIPHLCIQSLKKRVNRRGDSIYNEAGEKHQTRKG